jgi:malonyl-CoA decarboxylase
MNTSFFGELLQAISDQGKALVERTRGRRGAPADRSESLVDMCEDLVSVRGEASGTALARDILLRFAELTTGPRIAFFEALAHRFGPDRERIESAVAAWQRSPSDVTAAELHHSAEPRRQELFRRLNMAPGGTKALVAMREKLMAALDHREDLAAVDADFVHLFSSWFNRGFLVLRRIDWSTPANILEKIIHYEAVHEIGDWRDLRARIDPSDRRCYAFFHPALVDEPLIFVEVALTREIADAIPPILSAKRDMTPAERATTAVFYSISNCQRGLAGVSFGSFLIKQVAAEISRELPRISTFVTLSPVPAFAAWLKRELKEDPPKAIAADDRAELMALETGEWFKDADGAERLREPLMRAAATFFLTARTRTRAPVDPVARFHLGNGARLERIDWLADPSPKGLAQSFGVMVNYLYDLDDIEKNHEAYAGSRTIVASSAVKKLARPVRDLVPVES